MPAAPGAWTGARTTVRWPSASAIICLKAAIGPLAPVIWAMYWPTLPSRLCSSRVAKALSPGDRKRGRFRSATTGSRTVIDDWAEPTALSVHATAMTRTWPLKAAAGRCTTALPSAPVSTTPDHRATVRMGVVVRPSPPIWSPPKLMPAAAPRLASSKRP